MSQKYQVSNSSMAQSATCECSINTVLTCLGALPTLSLPVPVGQLQCSGPDELQTSLTCLDRGYRGSIPYRGRMCYTGVLGVMEISGWSP